MNHNEWYDTLNWFKPIAPPQLLPKDILKGSRMISGEEAENHILSAVTRPPQITPNAMIGGTSSSWNSMTRSFGSGSTSLMNGDSIHFGALSVVANGSTTITNMQQSHNPMMRATETTVTYLTYDKDLQ